MVKHLFASLARIVWGCLNRNSAVGDQGPQVYTGHHSVGQWQRGAGKTESAGINLNLHQKAKALDTGWSRKGTVSLMSLTSVRTRLCHHSHSHPSCACEAHLHLPHFHPTVHPCLHPCPQRSFVPLVTHCDVVRFGVRQLSPRPELLSRTLLCQRRVHTNRILRSQTLTERTRVEMPHKCVNTQMTE